LKEQNVQFSAEIETFEQDGQKADKFIALAKKYTKFDTLTNTMLNEFIEKAVIHERTRNEYGDKDQDVDIYFNFISNFKLPEEAKPEPTPEEIAEQQRQGQKRAKQREYHRRRYAAEKQKTA